MLHARYQYIEACDSLKNILKYVLPQTNKQLCNHWVWQLTTPAM